MAVTSNIGTDSLVRIARAEVDPNYCYKQMTTSGTSSFGLVSPTWGTNIILGEGVYHMGPGQQVQYINDQYGRMEPPGRKAAREQRKPGGLSNREWLDMRVNEMRVKL